MRTFAQGVVLLSLQFLAPQWAAAALSTKSIDLTFVVKIPPGTPATDTIYVTGSTPELCNWQPKCIALRPIGHGVLRAQLQVGAYGEIEYKITRGSWDTVAADSFGRPTPNIRRNVFRPVHEFVETVVDWQDRAHHHGVSAALRSRLDVIPDFHSPELGNKRAVRVYLPESYASEPKRRYPVIYAHDGQNLFDPSTAGYGNEWKIDEVLDELASKRLAREAIVVGVDTIASVRRSEYDYSRRGDLYAKFLIETLKPWIDRTYRTHSGRESTYTMGSSMGALISMALVWKHADVFSRAAALSLPAMNSMGNVIVDTSPMPRLPIRLYVDYGDYGYDEDYPAPGQDFVEHLRSLGMKEPALLHRVFPYADHSEADWARRVDIPLSWMLAP